MSYKRIKRSRNWQTKRRQVVIDYLTRLHANKWVVDLDAMILAYALFELKFKSDLIGKEIVLSNLDTTASTVTKFTGFAFVDTVIKSDLKFQFEIGRFERVCHFGFVEGDWEDDGKRERVIVKNVDKQNVNRTLANWQTTHTKAGICGLNSYHSVTTRVESKNKTWNSGHLTLPNGMTIVDGDKIIVGLDVSAQTGTCDMYWNGTLVGTVFKNMPVSEGIVPVFGFYAESEAAFKGPVTVRAVDEFQ